jgi:hypothetical protein
LHRDIDHASERDGRSNKDVGLAGGSIIGVRAAPTAGWKGIVRAAVDANCR